MSRNHIRFIRPFLTLVIFTVLLCFGKGEAFANPKAAHPNLERVLSPDAQSGSTQVSLVGQLGGFTYGVAIQGSYALIGVGPRLVVLNNANPASPSFLGQTGVLPDVIEDIATSGSYAYLADDTGGLRIISFATPGAPVEVGYYDTGGNASGVAVSGNYAYIADGNAGLRIINISNPSAPSEAGYYNTAGYASEVAVSGVYAYVADGSNGLCLIRVDTPSSPTLVKSFDTAGYAYGIAVDKDYAYVADWTEGLRILSISSPTNIYEVGSFAAPTQAKAVSLSVSKAIVADYNNGLYIVNVSNPAAPVESGFLATGGSAYNLAVSGNYAYVADGPTGMRTIGIAALPPTEAGHFDISSVGYNVSVSGNDAYLATGYSGMQIVNISNPALPVEVTYQDTPEFATNVETFGNFAYIADGYGGLRIIDIANPAAPHEEGFNDSLSYAFNLAVSGSYAYVADYFFGLRIIDISVPTAPTARGSLYTLGYASGVAVLGSYAYVADETDGLRVINKSNPDAPSEVGFYDTAGDAYDVAVLGSYAYVADGSDGLRILNVTNPAAPTQAGFWDTPDTAQGVKVYGNYAYVADGNSGLRIINVSKPGTPSEVAFYDTPGYANDMVLSGNLVYVADGGAGLVILRVCTEPDVPVLVSPSNGGTISNDNTPTFAWNAAAFASEYQIQVDNNSNFSSPEIDITVNTTDYTPAAPLNNATYYWRVRGRNLDSGCDSYGPYSSSWSVRLAVPPGAFSKLTPANGALGLTDLIPLSWQSSSGATSYEICVDTSNDNACSAWMNVGMTTALYYDIGPNYATTFYWQVRACNTICAFADSNTWWNFTTNDQYEPDNDPAHATLVKPGSTYHSIFPTADVDWIKFTLTQELAVFLQTSGGSSWSTKMSLYNSADLSNPIERNSGLVPGAYASIDRSCNVDTLPAGTYYVKVEASLGGSIPVYRLSLTTWGCKLEMPVLMNNYSSYFEGPFELEPNNSAAQANGPIRSGQDYQGYPDDANDYFSFVTKTSGTITVNLANHTGTGVQLLLYAQTGETLTAVGIDNTAPYQIIYAGAPGSYYVRIYTASDFNNTTPYTLKVTYP